jgi:hypothetical protein
MVSPSGDLSIFLGIILLAVITRLQPTVSLELDSNM